MKTKFYLLTLMLLSFALNTVKADNKDWTLLVYLIGADLESGSDAGTTDMLEMIAAGTTDWVNVIVLTGGADKDGWRTPKTWLINNGVKTELSFVPSATHMTDSANITEFINWGTTNYPAQSYMLTFWNHGSDVRGYGNDEISKTNLPVTRIKNAIANSDFIKNDKKFDVIGFDACLMGCIEVQSALQNLAWYYVGSEELEPGHGWNYTPIIQAMEDGLHLNGNEIGTVIVDSFKAHSIAEETTAITLSVTDLTKIPELQSKLELLFAKVKDDSVEKILQKARGKAEEYGKETKSPVVSEDMVDIGDLMKKLKLIDPSLSAEIDAVMTAYNATIVHHVNDAARPLATGMSMYLPHNVLPSEGELEWVMNENYKKIDFSASIQDFVENFYLKAVKSDSSAPSGNIISGDKSTKMKSALFANDFTSGIQIDPAHEEDLEQVQIVLMEEFTEFPDELIMLGSTFPDNITENEEGTIYSYTWDGYWLGINGFPAYISELYDYEVETEGGDVEYLTRIYIPAILHPDTEDEMDISIAYHYDEDFNITLESIIPASYEDEDGNRIVAKSRIQLAPGDRVQLLYESFNTVTDEEFFVVDDRSVFTIVNGNEDLKLEYAELDDGTYHVGYVLSDYSQNDTLIYDTEAFDVYTTVTNSAKQKLNQTKLYPNPSNQSLMIDNGNFTGEQYKVSLYDITGKLCFEQTYNTAKASINTNQLANGVYNVKVSSGDNTHIEKLIIQH